jgi:hypothetical protein
LLADDHDLAGAPRPRRQQALARAAGRDHRLTDAEGTVLKDIIA